MFETFTARQVGIAAFFCCFVLRLDLAASLLRSGRWHRFSLGPVFVFNETHSQVCLWWSVTAIASSVDPHLRPVRRFLRARLAGRWVAWSPPLEGLDSSPASSWQVAFGGRPSAAGRCCLAGGAPRLTRITPPLRQSVTARCAVQCRERSGAERESSGTRGVSPDHDLCRRSRRPHTDDCDRLGQPRDTSCLHGGRSRLGNSSRGGCRGRSWNHLRAARRSWDVADGVSGTIVFVSLSFLVLGTDSLEAALSHLDDELVSPAELICFVPDSFIMPVPRRLVEAWERHVPSELQMEGSVSPREEAGWEFEDARERPSHARAPTARAKRPAGARGRGSPISETVQPLVKPPTQAQNIAEIRQLLGERFRRAREEDDGPGARHSGVQWWWISGRAVRYSAIPLGAAARRGSVRRPEETRACWKWLLVRSIPRPPCAMHVPRWAHESMNLREEGWSKIRTLFMNSRPEFRNYRMKLDEWLEICKDAESTRSGLSHVSQSTVVTSTFSRSWQDAVPGLLSRNDKPPDTWDTHGMSGTFVKKKPRRLLDHLWSIRTHIPTCNDWKSKPRHSFGSEMPFRNVSHKFIGPQRGKIFKGLWGKSTKTADFGSSFCQIPYTSNICLLEDKIQNWGMYLFTVSYGSCRMDRRSGDGWISGWSQIFAFYERKSWSRFRVTRRANCFSTEQNHPEYPLQ